MQIEREHEAKHPGPQCEEEKKQRPKQESQEGPNKVVIETTNVTSANANRQTLLKRKAHVQLIQEHCLNPTQHKNLKNEARRFDKIT